ncbi:MAG: hypothetical protein ACI4RG_10665 [Huintestinicola sp.]
MLTVIKVKFERFLKSLDVNVTLKKRELVLAIAACTLLGIVIGAILSPRKNTVIGSYNSADHYNKTDDDFDEEE